MSRLNKWTRISLAAAIATLPLQLNIFVYQTLWGRGFVNPYSSIWFSITELFLILAGVLFFISLKYKKKKLDIGHPTFFFFLLILIGIATISLLLSPFYDPSFHLFLFIKLLELLLLYLLIVNRILKVKEILKVFTYSMCFQALLATIQVLLQSDLGLYFLGEPHLSENTAHIARFSIGESNIIRGYGTFSHPNILGGFLVISLFCSLLFSPKGKHGRSILISLLFLGLLASFSRSAIFAFTIGLIVLYGFYASEIKKSRSKLIPVALILLVIGQLSYIYFSRGFDLLQDPAFLERIEGYRSAWAILLNHPFGLGPHHFTLFLDEVSLSMLMPWQYQPVHNIYLLALVELGVVGLLGAAFLVFHTFKNLYHKAKKLLAKEQLFKKRILIIIFLCFLIIGFFDHYLISLDQGLTLLILFYAIVSRFAADPSHVLTIKKGENLNKILAGQ